MDQAMGATDRMGGMSGDVRRYARDSQEDELDLLRTLAQIPAPSHHEGRRARFVEGWLRGEGARDVWVDDAGNVLCLLRSPGAGHDPQRPIAVFAAHTDVVFDDDDTLPLHEDADRLYAPGVGDDTANLANLLMATRYLLRSPEALARATRNTDLLVVADACEEGLGNLDGCRALFEGLGERVAMFFSLDLYLPQCISGAVGSERYRIEVDCTGGHSYHDFGRANAVLELCRTIDDLYAIEPPTDPETGARTTLNVGTIEGGTTVNSIPAHASALFEYRSESAANLARMREAFDRVVARRREDLAARDEAGDVRATAIGIRPGASGVNVAALREMTSRSARIVREVTDEEPDLSPASTDANVPLSLGVCANTVGTVRGALLHTRDEWVDKSSLPLGLEVVLRLMLED